MCSNMTRTGLCSFSIHCCLHKIILTSPCMYVSTDSREKTSLSTWCRSKEMIEVYRSVYHLRQQLLSLKEGLEIKKSTGMDHSIREQSDSSDAEEESTSLQTKASGIRNPVQCKISNVNACLTKITHTHLHILACVHVAFLSLPSPCWPS